MKDLGPLLMRSQQTLRDAMACIDHNGEGIALVVDEQNRLLNTITDGDLRRAVLAGRDLDQPVSTVMKPRGRTRRKPVTAPVGTSAADLLALMRRAGLRHIPMVDARKRVVEVALLRELALATSRPMTAVVMAGGLGTRLRPLTEQLPKPMLPVGDRPVMEHVLEQLQKVGISRISITTHYKPDAIIEHFGDGHRFGVEISYVNEQEPMGTAGSLGLLGVPDGPVLVINGDVLTQVNYRSMLDYHQDNQAAMTVGVRRFEVQVPYGVIDMEGTDIIRLDEKPTYQFFINAGVYMMEPTVFSLIKDKEKLDATDLIDRLMAVGKKVVGFPIHEYWLDIGRPDDYQQANEDFTDG